MANEKTKFHQRIESGQSLLLSRIDPPAGGNPEAIIETANRFKGKVHAVGVSDNRNRVRMSALAAAGVFALEGMESILHLTTRDRNRVGLLSTCLGAEALGVRNILCTSGAHQTLGRFREAKNVFDIDAVQLMQAIDRLPEEGLVIGEENIQDIGPFCLGGVAAPFADPVDFQLMRVDKKIAAGTHFLITQPVFNLERFTSWWKKVVELGFHEKVTIIAGIRILTNADEAVRYAEERPSPMIPDDMLQHLTSQDDPATQQSAGIQIAVDTIKSLRQLIGLRGFELHCPENPEAIIEVIEQAGLKTE